MYTPVTTDALPTLQKQLALEIIHSVASSSHGYHLIYTDGSIQTDQRSGCAIYSPTTNAPPGGWQGSRLPSTHSSTPCELHGIIFALRFLYCRHLNGLIICDSKSALQSLTCHKPVFSDLVKTALNWLTLLAADSRHVIFLWVPSHIGLYHSDRVDLLAKHACTLPLLNQDSPPLLSTVLSRFRVSATRAYAISADDNAAVACTASQRHYQQICRSPFVYRRHGFLIRRHNIVSARLRLGYRPPWQVFGHGTDDSLSACRLCSAPQGHSLDHYCCQCPSLAAFLPRGPTTSTLDICRFFCSLMTT